MGVAASLLFGAADVLQRRVLTTGAPCRLSITLLFPSVMILGALTLVDYIRMPAVVGELYESED